MGSVCRRTASTACVPMVRVATVRSPALVVTKGKARAEVEFASDPAAGLNLKVCIERFVFELFWRGVMEPSIEVTRRALSQLKK